MSYLDNICDLESFTIKELKECKIFLRSLGERPNFIFIDKYRCFCYEYMFEDYRDIITYYPGEHNFDIWSSVNLIGEGDL